MDNNINLSGLYLAGNNLSNLDVSNLVDLEVLDLGYWERRPNSMVSSSGGNSITNIDLTNNKKLVQLYINNNQLTELDVSKNSALTSLNASFNKLTELDVSKNPALIRLGVSYNQLSELDVSKNPTLNYLSVNNNKLTRLDVSKNTVLTDLYVYFNRLTEFDISRNTALKTLWVYYNKLTELDVSKNPALTDLDVSNNKLTELDVSKNPALTDLDVNNNKLTELDVSKNIVLTDLRVYNNQLTKLNVSKNTALTDLYVHGNQLTEFDISRNTALKTLWVYNNKLTELDVSQNPALTSLYVSGNPYKFSDVITYIHEKSTFNLSTPVVLFNGKTNSVSKISKSSYVVIEDDTISGSKAGVYPITVTYKHNVQTSNNSYDVTSNLYVIEATSEKYTINNKDGYIYVGSDVDSNTILNNIDLNYGTKEIVNNEIIIKYENKVVKTFKIVGIQFKKMMIYKDLLLIAEDMSYQDFTTNIVANGVTYKIFSDDKELNSGIISDDMTLRVYKNDEVLDEYDILVEFLDLSLLSVREDKLLIKDLALGTKVSELKSKILTSGTVKILDKNNKELKDDDIVKTGIKVNIYLSGSGRTYEYTLSVKGDITGTGTSTVSDVAKLYQYLRGKIKMDYCYIEAGNVVGDEVEIKVNDVAKLYQFIKGKISSLF